MHRFVVLLAVICFITACQQDTERSQSVFDLFQTLESIPGKSEYLQSPYVTAGDRLYVVGQQSGQFIDHGWHVPGEMGGVWDHPIKLMDGFAIMVNAGTQVWKLQDAESFTNYPIGNRMTFNNESLGLAIERIQFVPDQVEGVVLELVIQNTGTQVMEATLQFDAVVDLMPVWISERLEIEDGEDEITWDDAGYFLARDSQNPWFAAWATDLPVESQSATEGQASILSNLALQPGEKTTVHYFVAGSYRSQSQAIATLEDLRQNYLAHVQSKIERYAAMAEASQIDIPDPNLLAMYNWTQYNTDWLIRDVDTIGRGLSAGMADYPWWFGADNCYSLQGLLATGQHEEVYATIDLLAKLSIQANGMSGQIIHEASTNGVVFNPGNLNETPHFVYLLWKVYEWTGNRTFLEKHYDLAKAAMKWILSQDHDDNQYADGPGMMEIPGLHTEMIDVVVYTQQGAEALSKMAQVMGDEATASEYQQLAETLKERINTEWWSESSESYADFRADKAKTLELIDAAIIRSDTINKPWAVEELETTKKAVQRQTGEVQSQVVYHNWVVNTPMEMGIAEASKAQKALEKARQYRSKYGSYVTGLDRDESKGESTKWEVFSYVGAVMTLPTGVQAIAENNYGNPDEAYTYLQQLTNSFSYALPGSTYEVSPDYGMMAQAWNIYAVAYPIVNQFFGFRPDAGSEVLYLEPNMPSGWDNVSITNVKVGENLISLEKTTNGNVVTYQITQSQNWEIQFQAQGMDAPHTSTEQSFTVTVD